jgi:hypothetical protein
MHLSDDYSEVELPPNGDNYGYFELGVTPGGQEFISDYLKKFGYDAFPSRGINSLEIAHPPEANPGHPWMHKLLERVKEAELALQSN